MNLLPFLSLLIVLAVSSVKVLGDVDEYPECNDVQGYMHTFEDDVKQGKTVSCKWFSKSPIRRKWCKRLEDVQQKCPFSCGCGEPWTVKFEFPSHDYLKKKVLEAITTALNDAVLEAATGVGSVQQCEINCHVSFFACSSDCHTEEGPTNPDTSGPFDPLIDYPEFCLAECIKQLNKCLRRCRL